MPVSKAAAVEALSAFGGFLPAHDLVGEEDATHLRVLVLTLVQDGLMGRKQGQVRQFNYLNVPV